MPGDPRPIGVFDSGMGGLTVLRALVARLPRERFVYLGDTARLPYGTKSAETVQAYALQATGLLLDQGVKMLVIACNTASSVALYLLQEAWQNIPVIGVIEPGARAGVAATRNRRIAVIATEGTVKGGAYARAIRKLMADAEIVQQPCQVFVALAEEGWTTRPPPRRRRNTISGRCSGALRRRIRWCWAAPTFRCSPMSSARPSARTWRWSIRRRPRRRRWRKRSPARGSRAARTPAADKARFFATDSPERFARVGAIFFGRPIDATAVELVDLRA